MAYEGRYNYRRKPRGEETRIWYYSPEKHASHGLDLRCARCQKPLIEQELVEIQEKERIQTQNLAELTRCKNDLDSCGWTWGISSRKNKKNALKAAYRAAARTFNKHDKTCRKMYDRRDVLRTRLRRCEELMKKR